MIPIIDPATEEQISEFTYCGPEAINDAVARAKATAESGVWSGLPDYDRAKVLWRVADLIDENADILAELESLNAGIPPAQAQIITKVGSEWFRYYAGWCTKIDGIARDVNTGGLTGVDSHMHTYTLREPYGVVGLIFPANGPVFNYCAKLAPSLAAGCSSVVKPAEETPLSALVLDRILAEAGVPEGVVNLVNGYAHTAGAAITAHRDVEKVAFTGSTQVGRAIVHAAADSNLNKVTLELGGGNPGGDLRRRQFGRQDRYSLMITSGRTLPAGPGPRWSPSAACRSRTSCTTSSARLRSPVSTAANRSTAGSRAAANSSNVNAASAIGPHVLHAGRRCSAVRPCRAALPCGPAVPPCRAALPCRPAVPPCRAALPCGDPRNRVGPLTPCNPCSQALDPWGRRDYRLWYGGWRHQPPCPGPGG